MRWSCWSCFSWTTGVIDLLFFWLINQIFEYLAWICWNRYTLSEFSSLQTLSYCKCYYTCSPFLRISHWPLFFNSNKNFYSSQRYFYNFYRFVSTLIKANAVLCCYMDDYGDYIKVIKSSMDFFECCQFSMPDIFTNSSCYSSGMLDEGCWDLGLNTVKGKFPINFIL